MKPAMKPSMVAADSSPGAPETNRTSGQRFRKTSANQGDPPQCRSVPPAGGLSAIPLTRDEVNGYIVGRHRHHGKVTGYRYGIGAELAGELVGVAAIGRPRARLIEQYRIAEVTRVCTEGGHNVCSFLYGVCARLCRLLGFRAIFTCILESEPGTSLKAAGRVFVRSTRGGSQDRPSRRRTDQAPTCPKQVWAPPWAVSALAASVPSNIVTSAITDKETEHGKEGSG